MKVIALGPVLNIDYSDTLPEDGLSVATAVVTDVVIAGQLRYLFVVPNPEDALKVAHGLNEILSQEAIESLYCSVRGDKDSLDNELLMKRQAWHNCQG